MPGDASPSASNIKFEMSLGPSPRTRSQPRARDASTPLGILILGNFNGNANRTGQPPISQRRAWAVDSDNFETIMARITPALSLQKSPDSSSESNQQISLPFTSTEDFHPDSVLR